MLFFVQVFEDPGDLLWTHLELLRKCKLVAVVQKPTQPPTTSSTPKLQPAPAKHKQLTSLMPPGSVVSQVFDPKAQGGPPARKTAPKQPVTLGKAKLTVLTETKSPNGGNRSGNNGQVNCPITFVKAFFGNVSAPCKDSRTKKNYRLWTKTNS